MVIEENKLKNIIEAALMAVAKPMSVDQLSKLFEEDNQPSTSAIKEAVAQLQIDSEGRGVELREIASGFRYQAKQEYSEWLSRLWEERPAKYSRAALETLALIAYRQPVTRAEIEDVRGVGVSSSIIKTMIEREWIRVVGHRDVPGRPALYATTKQFLDYFNMKSLDELPTLAEIKDLEDLHPELDLPNPDDERQTSELANQPADAIASETIEETSDIDNQGEPSLVDDESNDNSLADSGIDDDELDDDELDDVHTESSNEGFYARPEDSNNSEFSEQERLSEVEHASETIDNTDPSDDKTID